MRIDIDDAVLANWKMDIMEPCSDFDLTETDEPSRKVSDKDKNAPAEPMLNLPNKLKPEPQRVTARVDNEEPISILFNTENLPTPCAIALTLTLEPNFASWYKLAEQPNLA
jgi:hypothetical protein